MESFTELDGPAVASLSRATTDVVVFPGGSGGGQAKAIGESGSAAVKAFVAAGGGYYGTCAGGYLGAAASCCDVAMPGYCGGKVGCHPSAYGLGLLDAGVAEPWDRGHGLVEAIYTKEAVDMLHLSDRYADGPVSLLYYQGPIFAASYGPGNFTAGAFFLSEIADKHPEFTTKQMVGTPALIWGTFGAGRVLISPPHPEETVPRLDDVVLAYTLWAGRAI